MSEAITYPIKIVEGNWVRIKQPLEKINWNENSSKPFSPSEAITVNFVRVNSTNNRLASTKYSAVSVKKINANGEEVSNGTILNYEINGILPLGLYSIEIFTTLNSKTLRSFQKDIIQIVATNTEANIPQNTEFDTTIWNLGVTVLTYVPGCADGVGVASIEQTTTSTASGGINVITATLTNGTESTFQIRNGLKGDKGEQGEQGPKGDTGARGQKGDTGAVGITPNITINANVDDTVGTPNVSVSRSGTNLNPQFTFSFTGLKGEPGEGGGGSSVSITIDDTLSSESENPVQNKIITAELNNKADTNDLSEHTNDTDIHVTAEDKATWSGKQDAGDYVTNTELETALTYKQDKLVSGTNIKTINNIPILGDGNISISGGEGADGVGIDSITQTTNTESDAANIITIHLTNGTDKTVTIYNGAQGAPGTDGTDGIDGTDGTNGTDGNDGKSAYEIAVENGFSGTEVEWLASLKGADGTDGTDGVDATITFRTWT